MMSELLEEQRLKTFDAYLLPKLRAHSEADHGRRLCWKMKHDGLSASFVFADRQKRDQLLDFADEHDIGLWEGPAPKAEQLYWELALEHAPGKHSEASSHQDVINWLEYEMRVAEKRYNATLSVIKQRGKRS